MDTKCEIIRLNQAANKQCRGIRSLRPQVNFSKTMATRYRDQGVCELLVPKDGQKGGGNIHVRLWRCSISRRGVRVLRSRRYLRSLPEMVGRGVIYHLRVFRHKVVGGFILNPPPQPFQVLRSRSFTIAVELTHHTRAHR